MNGNKKQENKREYLGFIDGIKGIAILCVILAHLPVEHFRFINIGLFPDFGVALFFIISSYTLSLSWGRKKNHKKNLQKFYLRRLRRILPFYYLVVFAIFSLPFLASFHLIHPSSYIDQLTWQNFLLSVTFVGLLVPIHFSLDIGEWYVYVQLWFYLFFPILFILLNSLKKTLIVEIICVCLTILLFIFYSQDIYNLQILSTLPRYLPTFLLGFILYHLHPKQIFHKKYFLFFILTIGLFIIHKFTSIVLIPGLIAGVFILFIKDNASNMHLISSSFIRYIGKASYLLYLWNVPIIVTVRFLLNLYNIHDNFVSISILALVFILLTPLFYRLEIIYAK